MDPLNREFTSVRRDWAEEVPVGPPGENEKMSYSSVSVESPVSGAKSGIENLLCSLRVKYV